MAKLSFYMSSCESLHTDLPMLPLGPRSSCSEVTSHFAISLTSELDARCKSFSVSVKVWIAARIKVCTSDGPCQIFVGDLIKTKWSISHVEYIDEINTFTEVEVLHSFFFLLMLFCVVPLDTEALG